MAHYFELRIADLKSPELVDRARAAVAVVQDKVLAGDGARARLAGPSGEGPVVAEVGPGSVRLGFNGRRPQHGDEFWFEVGQSDAVALTTGEYAFNSCDPQGQPYGELVVAVLAILKHHLGDSLRVSSDDDEDYDGQIISESELALDVLGRSEPIDSPQRARFFAQLSSEDADGAGNPSDATVEELLSALGWCRGRKPLRGPGETVPGWMFVDPEDALEERKLRKAARALLFRIWGDERAVPEHWALSDDDRKTVDACRPDGRRFRDDMVALDGEKLIMTIWLQAPVDTPVRNVPLSERTLQQIVDEMVPVIGEPCTRFMAWLRTREYIQEVNPWMFEEVADSPTGDDAAMTSTGDLPSPAAAAAAAVLQEAEEEGGEEEEELVEDDDDEEEEDDDDEDDEDDEADAYSDDFESDGDGS